MLFSMFCAFGSSFASTALTGGLMKIRQPSSGRNRGYAFFLNVDTSAVCVRVCVAFWE